MGLLDIFIQNQSQLDVTPTPQQGNGPIAPATGEFNTGTTPFQQVWDSSNTYINSFEGGVNTGIQPPRLLIIFLHMAPAPPTKQDFNHISPCSLLVIPSVLTTDLP